MNTRTCWDRFRFILISAVFAYSAVSQVSAQERLPIIFAPGLGTSAAVLTKYSPIIKIFREHGYNVKIADTVSSGSLEVRMQSFVASANALVPSGNFHIVAHSTGGIDARLAIYRGMFGSRVVSLTTLSSPHRGTSAAEYLLEYLKKHPSKLIPTSMLDAFHDLTVESMSKFNAEVVNDPTVQYFSMGFYIPNAPIFFYTENPIIWAGHKIIASAGEGPNDGIISAKSAQWGTSLGEMPADHFSEELNIPFAGRIVVGKIMNRVIENLDQL